MKKIIHIDNKIFEDLERANYMEQATRSLYLEALERGIATQQAKREYVTAFVELDKIKCQVSTIINEPNVIRWDANFQLKHIEVVLAN